MNCKNLPKTYSVKRKPDLPFVTVSLSDLCKMPTKKTFLMSLKIYLMKIISFFLFFCQKNCLRNIINMIVICFSKECK